MPKKARYWKNPDLYRQMTRDYNKKMRALGYKGGIKDLSTYLRRLDDSNTWNKQHRECLTMANRRHRLKLKVTVNCSSERGRWLFKLLGGARAFNKTLLQLPELQANGEGLRRALQRSRHRTETPTEARRTLDMQQMQAITTAIKKGNKAHGAKTGLKVK